MIALHGETVDASRLKQACGRLRHRGPDHANIWVHAPDGAVALAATRLAVLDPSPEANQPMRSADGRHVLVYNGEVYNFKEIRAELQSHGAMFRTQGDTEVVLEACGRWGVKALRRFNGMWALCYFDAVAGRGFLARDRFGIKPLFWKLGGSILHFASELPALRPLCPSLNGTGFDALAEHLIFGFINGEKTIYQNTYRLLPGHYLEFTRQDTPRPQRYYDLSVCRSSKTAESQSTGRRPPALNKDDDQAISNSNAMRDAPRDSSCGEPDYDQARACLRRLLADACVARRVADVPVGVLLSGGVDSSIVVYHLSEALGRPVETFSVGYAGQQSYDETAFARLVARRYGTNHHELLIGDREVLAALPRILDHLGEPFGDSSIIPAALVSEFARQCVTVALSGDGSDELFGGYWRYLGHEALGTYLKLPSPVRRTLIEPLLGKLAAGRSSVISNRVRQWRKLLRAADADPLARHVSWSRILSGEAADLFLDGRVVDRIVRSTIERAHQSTSFLDPRDALNRILAFDLQHQLPADMLQKVDLAGMMHSLEVRVPFLDHRVVEAAVVLPSRFKIYRGCRKRLLVDAYRGRVPDEVLDRPKQGFEVPVGEYFRGPLASMFHDVVSRGALESLGLAPPVVGRIFQEHLHRRADHADLLFALLSLCWWAGHGG